MRLSGTMDWDNNPNLPIIDNDIYYVVSTFNAVSFYKIYVCRRLANGELCTSRKEIIPKWTISYTSKVKKEALRVLYNKNKQCLVNIFSNKRHLEEKIKESFRQLDEINNLKEELEESIKHFEDVNGDIIEEIKKDEQKFKMYIDSRDNQYVKYTFPCTNDYSWYGDIVHPTTTSHYFGNITRRI